MLPQEILIEKVKSQIQHDERLVAAMMYGSFTVGEGDAFSDIEFSLYFQDESLPSVDKKTWVEQIAPMLLMFRNEFGIEVAIFEGLIRGEFHFEPASQMHQLRQAAWGMTDKMNPEAMCLLDKTGELQTHLAYLKANIPNRHESAESLAHLFINWFIFGLNVLHRGEHARAHELLGILHRYLLWMARITEHQLDHWPTPSRAAEHELSPEAYARFAACTADLAHLEQAYQEVWRWGRALIIQLNIVLPDSLISGIHNLTFPDDKS